MDLSHDEQFVTSVRSHAKATSPLTPQALRAFALELEPGTETELALDGVAGDLDSVDDLFVGAGLEPLHPPRRSDRVRLRRVWTIPDTIADDLCLVICGLNPSPAAADAGIGFARPGNRFWPAALAAGLVSVDRDADAALEHGIGMTDLVKRTTRRADELHRDEYRAGFERLRRLADRHRPSVICFVGLAGWRVAHDRKAAPGLQDVRLGPSQVYLMPSTSGLNAHARLEDLTEHLRSAAALAGR